MTEFKKAIVDAYGKDAAIDMLFGVLEKLPTPLSLKNENFQTIYQNKAGIGLGDSDACETDDKELLRSKTPIVRTETFGKDKKKQTLLTHNQAIGFKQGDKRKKAILCVGDDFAGSISGPGHLQHELCFKAMGNLSQAVAIRDKDLVYRMVNSHYEALFGVTAEAMLGKTAVDVFGVKAAQRFDPDDKKVLETGKGYNKEMRLSTPDGRTVTSLTDVKRIVSANGEPFVCITITDVTDLKNREDALARKKTELALASAALSNMSSAVLIKDETGTYRLANKRFAELHGLEPDEMIGKKAVDLYGEDLASKFEMREKQVMETGQSLEIEESVALPDGTKIETLTVIQRIMDNKGRPSLCIVVNDVTDQFERQKALEKAKSDVELAKNRFEAFAKTNSDWFWEMDAELRFSFFSEKYESITGVPPERLLGKTRREAGIPGASQEDYNAHLKMLTDHEPFRDFVHSRTKNDGTVVWLSISGTPFFDGNGNFCGYQGSGRDVTERILRQKKLEAAEKAALQADKAKSEFLANMSHEIRTPMNGVMGMAELLTKTRLDTKQKTYTDVIVKSGGSLLAIINDILDFSKLDAGQMELDPAPFNLTEAIEDVATLVSSKVAEKDLELIVRIDPQLPQNLIGDVGRIRQIITNLLGNAVKFTENGHVYVNVMDRRYREDTGKRGIRVEVEDTGIGIPEEDRSAIFEKFRQVDGSSSRKHEGTGLGLAIAASLVEIMNGKIGVDSEVGKGSVFWFELELPEDNEGTKEKPVPVDVTGARVLVIDDNGVNRNIMSEQMAEWRFDSASCVDGFEALAVMRKACEQAVTIDCVVLDYQMPGMNGGEVVKQMRAEEGLRDIPVIVLTSVSQTEDGELFSALGIQAHLMKPVRSSRLLETIIAVISENEARNGGGKTFAEEKIDIFEPIATEVIEASEVAANEPEAALLEPPVSRLEPGSSETSASVEQIDVLICEDNEVNQIVFTQILQSANLTYRIAPNGEKGVEMTQELSPSVILMDISMPVMNGLEATAAIREIERNSGHHTPIIGVTAHAIKGDMEKCIQAGMDDYLSKPVSPDKLQEKVFNWLRTVEEVRKA